MLRSYALSPETLRRFLLRSFWRFQLITTLSFLGFGIYLAFFASPVDWRAAGPIVVIIALAYFFIIFFNIRQQLRLLYATRYELNGSSLTFRQALQKPMHIMRADILSVEECQEGLRVSTADPRANLLIPHGLVRNGDADFDETLEAWVGIKRSLSQRRAQTWLLLLAVLASLLVVLFANTLWFIIPLGILTVAFSLYAERRMRLAPGATPGIARTYSLAFSFVIFVIVMKSCVIALALAR